MNDNLKGWAPATYLEPVNVNEEIKEKGKLMKEPSEGSIQMASSGIPLSCLFGYVDLDIEKYLSTGEYIGQDEDEISFPEGVIVTVLHKYMDGWWYVSYSNEKGYAPSSFLEPAVDIKKADQVGLS